jgi:hypothetical protein
LATQELCNGLDDDCDGEIDEDYPLGEPCSVGVGACLANATYICAANETDVVCNATPGAPQNETCNWIDDDCDGEIDEDFDLDNDGYTTCGGDCNDTNASINPGMPEDCGDGVDNDCNGDIDGADSACAPGAPKKPKKSSSSSGGSSSSFSSPSLGDVLLEPPETEEEPESDGICECVFDSAEISKLEVLDNIASVTVTKLDDCRTGYVVLLLDLSAAGDEFFILEEYGDEALIEFSVKDDWEEINARLYCSTIYFANQLEGYIDEASLARERDETAAEPIVPSPTGMVTAGDMGLWILGLLLLLLLLFLYLRKRKKDEEK